MLTRAEKLAEAGAPVGTYFLQAAIAACHARAIRAEDTDWQRIADLYDVLALAAPGPVIEVNRAVAHGRAYGRKRDWRCSTRSGRIRCRGRRCRMRCAATCWSV